MTQETHDPRPETPRPGLPPALLSSLRCPLSGHELRDGIDEAGQLVLISPTVGLAYPVRDGVPILLVHEALRAPAHAPDSQS